VDSPKPNGSSTGIVCIPKCKKSEAKPIATIAEPTTIPIAVLLVITSDKISKVLKKLTTSNRS